MTTSNYIINKSYVLFKCRCIFNYYFLYRRSYGVIGRLFKLIIETKRNHNIQIQIKPIAANKHYTYCVFKTQPSDQILVNITYIFKT